MSSTIVCVVEPVNNKVLPTDKSGLPWELWQMILSWLSVLDLCRVARVCRTWNELVNSLDGTRWKELYLACNEWRHPFWPLNTKVEPPSWRQAYRDQYMATTFWKWRHKHEVNHTSCSLFFKRTSLHKTVHVGAGLEHEDLKSALAVANAYDRIVVHPGIYDEQFEITAKIPFELIGDGELGSIILVVGIQQVALTARLSNLVLRAPWFTSFIVMINSGYLQIDKCILEEGMICAQSPSTLHIKFCTFRHATVILQHMNTSVIENCEFSQSYSANIIIEGQPKSEKNWTYTYLREQTNAIFHQKRSMHRKKHGLKNTTSMTSTLHSSFTSKSLTTGYSTHIYDTISHDPSCNLDDPGATFLHPNILSGRYPGTEKDGMVGCGDLQSMYQEPDDPDLPSAAVRKSSLSLPASKPNHSNKQPSRTNSTTVNSTTTITTNSTTDKSGTVIHQQQQLFKSSSNNTTAISASSSKTASVTATATSDLKTVATIEHKDSNNFNNSLGKKSLVCLPPQDEVTNGKHVTMPAGASTTTTTATVLAEKYGHVNTNEQQPFTIIAGATSKEHGDKMPNCNSDSKDDNNDDHTQTQTHTEYQTHPQSLSKSCQDSTKQNQHSRSSKAVRLPKRRGSRSSCQMHRDIESHHHHNYNEPLPLPQIDPAQLVSAFISQNAAAAAVAVEVEVSASQTTNSVTHPTTTTSDSLDNRGSSSRRSSKVENESECHLKRKERSGSDGSKSKNKIPVEVVGHDYATGSKSGKSCSGAVFDNGHNINNNNNNDIDHNNGNDIQFHRDNDNSDSKPHHKNSLFQFHGSSSSTSVLNSNSAGNEGLDLNSIQQQHGYGESSSDDVKSRSQSSSTRRRPSLPIPPTQQQQQQPLSPSDSSLISGVDGSRPPLAPGPRGRRHSPSADQDSIRRYHSDDGDTIGDSDDDSISILDELDHSDDQAGYPPNRNSSSSSSDSSSDILSANYSGSSDEFSSSEESVIMLPHLREFDLQPLEYSTSPRGVQAEIASITSDCTRPVPVNVSEDKMMSSFVDHIQGVLVHQCRMNHSKGGLMVTLQAHAIISECEINNVGYGIRCIHNSRVVILKNKIHHCRTSGIFMRLSASGLIAGNDIHSNNEAGIDIRKNADPLVQFNQIHHGKRSGVVVLGSGRGQIKKNDIFGNAEAGVYILYGGNPTVSENYIYEGRAAGVAINAKGKGFIIDNVIRGNRWGGIDIRNSSCPVVSGNSIINGLSDGIVVGVGGKGNIENNIITGNSGSGIWMMSAKHLNIHGNQICCNGHCGVVMLDKSTSAMDVHLNQLMPGGITHHSFSQYEDHFVHPEPKAAYAIVQYNNISHNKSQGVVVEIQEEVHISHNAVHGNLKDGVVMVQDAPALVESNSITHNTGHGLVTSNRNKVRVTGNGIYDNTQHGVLCQNECVLEDNDVVGQAKCAVMVDGHSSVELVNNRLSSSSEPAVRGGKLSRVVAKRNKIYDKGGGDFACEGEITTAHNSLARPTLVLEYSKRSSEKEFGRTDFLCDPPPRPHAVPPPPVTTIPTHRVTVVTKVMMPSTEGCEQGSRLCVIL